ncbi:GTP-binding protein TypA/BipA [Nitzschia inconspicua]|uniref:GTP-binding protein TypA/BipA n=1 Tax=Nitzschia inconspicua TaxID=303405 RepID=A0A9K3Q1R6_9STRA|nr:GTP-binding protein TypA/BipA [Nitzschia inconspicua]
MIVGGQSSSHHLGQTHLPVSRTCSSWYWNLPSATTSAISSPSSSCEWRSFSSSAASDDDDGDSLSSHPIIRQRQGVLNLSILAHVDHGKTTLVDQLLRAASSSSNASTGAGASATDATTDRLLDCGDLEKERGITITSKVTRIDNYKNNIINVVDTPGHADFCGEVDRVLSLVSGAVLVVDALEGPMVQTKYVLSRALSMNLKPVVVLNKVDRLDGWARVESGETESDVLDLFDSLGASDDQMDYLTLYASAKQGWVTDDMAVAESMVHNNTSNGQPVDMTVMLDHLLRVIPPPTVETYGDASSYNDDDMVLPGERFAADPFSLAAITVGYDAYLGRTCTGRITSGAVSINDQVAVLRREADGRDPSTKSGGDGTIISTLNGIFVNRGISRVPLESGKAYAGDIVTLSGVPDSIRVGDTLTGTTEDTAVSRPIVTPPLVPPTLSMEFGANDSPLAGTEGTEVTPTKLRNRLTAETDNNVTLTVETSQSDSDKTSVYARGELQLGILIEQMRREGFEMTISPPRIVTKIDETDGKTILEPFEEVTVDVDSEYSGYIVSALTGDRKGILLEMNEDVHAKTRLRFEVPSRGLLGFPSEAATATRGSAVVNHVYLDDRKHVGPLGDGLEKGKLISSDSGKATHYALASLAARGVLFVEPGDVVYPGMVIGENAKQGDMEVNPVRAKATTNMRTQAKDEKTYLPPPKRMTVEELIGYMAPDEMIEVTPTTLRLRKALLDPVERRKASRVKKQQQDSLRKK